ncbi:hypothetical protein CXG81DRAFT_28913, partial [Caulochytrium protostelioides]
MTAVAAAGGGSMSGGAAPASQDPASAAAAAAASPSPLQVRDLCAALDGIDARLHDLALSLARETRHAVTVPLHEAARALATVRHAAAATAAATPPLAPAPPMAWAGRFLADVIHYTRLVWMACDDRRDVHALIGDAHRRVGALIGRLPFPPDAAPDAAARDRQLWCNGGAPVLAATAAEAATPPHLPPPHLPPHPPSVAAAAATRVAPPPSPPWPGRAGHGSPYAFPTDVEAAKASLRSASPTRGVPAGHGHDPTVPPRGFFRHDHPAYQHQHQHQHPPASAAAPEPAPADAADAPPASYAHLAPLIRSIGAYSPRERRLGAVCTELVRIAEIHSSPAVSRAIRRLLGEIDRIVQPLAAAEQRGRPPDGDAPAAARRGPRPAASPPARRVTTTAPSSAPG